MSLLKQADDGFNNNNIVSALLYIGNFKKLVFLISLDLSAF